MIDSKLLRGLVVCSSMVVTAAQVVAAEPPAPAPAVVAPPAAVAPSAECMGTLDRLSRDIPLAETGPALRRQGLRIRSPIIVADGAITETDVISAARVHVKLDQQGNVVPGSVTVQEAIGDPKLPLALTQAVPASLSFDVSGAFTVPKEFVFTTVYVVCAQK
ncbi:MAG: hypothetical protein ABI564_02765 [Ideonella sp.]